MATPGEVAGELDAARAAAERAIELQEKDLSGREGSQIVGAHMRLGHVAARAGRPRRAIEHLQRELASVGRVELERAAALRPRFTIKRARREPEFASLAGNPRFLALLDRGPF